MKNTLKLIIEAVRIAIDKISWNTLKDKPFYEESNTNFLVPEQTLENFEAIKDPIYVSVNQFTMTPIVGDTYTVNWDGNSYEVVAKDLDRLVCIGNENYVNMTSGGDIPFAIIFTGTDIFVAIESTETSYTEETHTISIFTTQTNIKKIDKKYLPEMGVKSWDDLEDRPFGTEISKIYLIEEQTITLDSNGRGNCIPIDNFWEHVYPFLGSAYEVEFDGEVYTGTIYEDGDMCVRTDFTTSSGVEVYIYNGSHIVSSSVLAGDHTIKLSVIGEVVTQIDDKYIPETISRAQDLETKMDKNNPSGTGSLSIGRQPNTLTGRYSQAIGNGVMATSKSQHVIGEYNVNTNDEYTEIITKLQSYNTSSKIYISENYTFDSTNGYFTLTNPVSGAANTITNLVRGNISVESYCFYMIVSNSTSRTMYRINYKFGSGSYPWVINGTIVYFSNPYSHVGVSTKDNRGVYAHIVGNGNNEYDRSNAHTLDWDGNAWYAGTIKLGGTSYDDASEVALKSDLINIDVGESSFITVDELTDYGAVVEYTESTNYNSYKIKVTKDFISPKQIIVVDTKDAKDTMVRFYYINPDASEKMIGMTTVYANNYRYFTIENDYFVTSVSQTKFQIEVTDILATNRYYANIDKSTGVFESKNSYVLTSSDLALYYANTNSASESYEPASDYNLATKKYVDDALANGIKFGEFASLSYDSSVEAIVITFAEEGE